MFIDSASPWIHLKEIRSWRTWSRSCLYSCAHCVLSCASVTFGWPLAGAGGGLGLAARAALLAACGAGTAGPGRPDVLAATFIQCVKSALSMDPPSTVATALPGTPPH